jgi:hypothetical protein
MDLRLVQKSSCHLQYCAAGVGDAGADADADADADVRAVLVDENLLAEAVGGTVSLMEATNLKVACCQLRRTLGAEASWSEAEALEGCGWGLGGGGDHKVQMEVRKRYLPKLSLSIIQVPVIRHLLKRCRSTIALAALVVLD